MGYTHIICVFEDGLRQAASTETELGHAVIESCTQQSSAALGPHVNCINYSDEVHSSDTRLYLWKGNCLRPIQQLDDRDLATAARVLADTQSTRAPSQESSTEAPLDTIDSIAEPAEFSGIGCPRCYRFIYWNGQVDTVRCQCGHVLHASNLARRLITAYSAPSLPNGPIGTLAHDLIRNAAQYAWGDAIRLGRRDWIQLGFPLTDAEFAAVIVRGDSVQLASCARILQEFESRDRLPETAAALTSRLSTEHDLTCRELLYRIAAAPQVASESLLLALRAAIHREAIGTIARQCCENAIGRQQASTDSP